MPYKSVIWKMVRTLLNLLVLLTCGMAAKGQQFVFENISERLRLPSLECYNIVQDAKGCLWIGGEQGLVRFNGTTSTVFDGRNGLPEKATYASLSLPDGGIVFASATNRLLVFRNGAISELPSSKSYQHKLAKRKVLNFTYQLYAHGRHLYMRSFTSLFRTVDHGRHLDSVRATPGSRHHVLLWNQGDVLLPIAAPSPASGNREISFGQLGANDVPPVLLPDTDGPWRIITAASGTSKFFTFGRMLVRMDAHGAATVHTLPSKIISLYADRQGAVWAGTVGNGVYCSKGTGSPVQSLHGLSVSGTCMDNEGNIWCTTLEQGVFVMRNRQILLHRTSPSFGILAVTGNRLWTSTPDGGIQFLDTAVGKFRGFGKWWGSFQHIWTDGQNSFLSSASAWYAGEANFRNLHRGSFSAGDNGIIATARGTGGTLYLLTSNSLYTFPKGRRIALSPMSGSLLYLGGQHLLAGGAKGLFEIDAVSGTVTRVEGIQGGVAGLLMAADSSVWVATRGTGLFVYKNRAVKKIDLVGTTDTEVFYGLQRDALGNIWAASAAGLLKFSRRGNGYAVLSFRVADGLPSDEVRRIAVLGDRLFATSADGHLFSMPLAMARDAHRPTLVLDSLLTNGKRNANGLLVLPFKGNSLVAKFNILRQPKGGNRLYYYLDSDRQATEILGRNLVLQRLAPGDYSLTAYPISGNGVRGKTFVLAFRVAGPFWMRWWFVAGTSALAALAAYLIVRWQSERSRRREREAHQIRTMVAESKLSALQARMNPHFIFNAINSIQNYIFKNQQEQARTYLTKFSHLIRMTLQQSAERTISLEKELAYLGLYIELEQLRFRNAFAYELRIAEELRTSQRQLPSMLLQPYIENAIWHGLMNLPADAQGKLGLNFYTVDDLLTVEIYDNGIGRRRAAELSRGRHHVSTGMVLTSDRLRMLRAIFSEKLFEVAVTDLHDGDGNATGTMVTVRIALIDDENGK